MTKNPHTSRTLSALLMVGASSLALATPAQANEYLFTGGPKTLATGERITQTEALTQVSLTGGGIASFTDNAEFQINEDGSIELYQGSVTVASENGSRVIVRMPEGLEGQVFGRGASANFSVGPDGKASGHALTGETRVGPRNRLRPLRAGEMWAADPGKSVRRVVANEARTVPEARPSEPQVAAIGGEAGPVAAALNGVPVTLGDALAAAGASSDILGSARRVEAAVGNPDLDTFPSDDLAALVARAAQIEGVYGGTPFPAAQADIIRAYLRFLAGNGGAGAGAQFLSAFSAFSLDYLDLIRVGGVPSGFAAAGQADINAYLAFIQRTGALAQLGAQDRVLAEAYLAFLRDGGNPDLFAASFTDLTNAYFAFVRGGGAPDAFEGASQAVLAQTIAFLSQSGLVQQLSASDRALVAAFLENGGLAFTTQFQSALDAYFAFLAAGNRPSDYEPVDQASLRQFLETLSNTGLLASVLGDQAPFYADYLAFLRAGGDIDDFAGLPVNIFTGYADQLAAYRAFLDAGNRPSDFAGGDPAQLQAFIIELQAAGALARFTGDDAAFFAAFAEFVNGGGAFDAFAGLNANIFAGYATQLQAYFAYLEAGGIPSAYEPLSQAVIAQYLAELQAAGAKARFLPELVDFYTAYFAFLSDGGNPDNFAGLPVPPDFGAFAAALNAYADFLANGGFPADFDGADLSVLAGFIRALSDAGELDARLGANADLLEAYFAFLAGGGAANEFAGLPIYADYVAQLNAYFAFLANGGLPQDYTELDQATLNAFLAALQDAQGGLAGFGNLNAFFADYAAFVLGGGDPEAFAGLPVYAQYVTDLNAYFAFLANGGLPEDYTVLDQATLNAYLAALANAQGGLAGFGELDDFFAAYAAFVLAGGNPTQFAGLPVYADYVAALNAYLAFLEAGGLPSDYTVLDQATLNAYLELLANAQGGLAGFAGLDVFFIDFFAFIAGGGDPDDFAELPVNVNRPRNVLNGINGWQFSADALRVTRVDAEVDDNGRITKMTVFNPNPVTTDYSGRDADLREFGRIGNDVAWTRYFVGTANGNQPNVSEHLLVGTPATAIPTSGTVQYALVGGTAPTDRNDVAGSTAFFTGNLGVAFGTVPLVGVDFEVLTRTAGYRVSTLGGAANPLNGGMGVDGNGRFENQNLPITPLFDATCSNFCQAQVFGGLFGEGGTSAGFTYNVFDRGFGASLQGVAIFATTGNALDGLGTRPDNTPPVPAGTGTPLILATVDQFEGDIGTIGIVARYEGEENPRRFLDANGAQATLDAANGATFLGNAFSTVSIGSARATDISGNDRYLIGRWTDGTIESNFAADTPLTTAQGAHYLVAAPLGAGFAIPSIGRVDYDLIAATAPTVADGQQAPGRFEAGLALLFNGSNIGLGFEATLTIPDDAGDFIYSVTTPGGLTDPSQSFFELVQGGDPSEFTFTIGNGHITTSDNACAGECRFNAEVAFGGDDVAQLAMIYNAIHPGRDGGQSIVGAAIFGTDQDVSGGGTGGGSGVPVNPQLAYQGGFDTNDAAINIVASFNTFAGSESGFQALDYTLDANGGLTSYRRAGNFTRSLGTARVFEASGNEDVLIGRWADGTLNGIANQTANQGLHYALVRRVPETFTVPTTGTVHYDLLAATAPTIVDGSLAPGGVEADMAILFGAAPRVAFEARIAMPDGAGGVADERLYSTLGGIAGAEQSETAINFASRGNFSFTVPGVVGANCSTDSCSLSASGLFAGDTSQLGLFFRAFNDQGGAKALYGAMIFGESSATATIPTRSAASIAPSTAPIASLGGEWARWGGSGSATSQGAGMPRGIDLLPPGASVSEARPMPSEISREAAIRQAERVMGGAITFARPGEAGVAQ